MKQFQYSIFAKGHEATSFAKAVILLLLLVLAAGCAEAPNIQTTPRFQMIKWPALRAYLLAFSYQDIEEADTIPRYWQSAGGDALYIPAGDLLKGYSLFLMRADQQTPLRVTLPMSNPVKACWVDPRGKIHFLPRFAFDENDRSTHTIVDDQSGFFFQATKDHVVYVGKMGSTTGWLFYVRETDQFIPSQVCASGDVIYLLDNRANGSVPAFMFSDKNCWAFALDPKNPAKYLKTDEFSVPGMVQVVDPFSPRFVCYGYSCMPFPGHPFLFDISTHKIVTALPEDKMVLFLNGDWLAPRLSAAAN